MEKEKKLWFQNKQLYFSLVKGGENLGTHIYRLVYYVCIICNFFLSPQY